MKVLYIRYLAKGLALVRGIYSRLVENKGELDIKDSTTPMKVLYTCKENKSAFTMVELVFVIVILGILASIGGNLLPDNRLLNDVNILTMKLKQKQSSAIGNSTYEFGEKFWTHSSSHNCLTLTKAGVEADEKHKQKPHRFNSKITLSETNSTICFDMYGRPYNEAQLLLEKLDINVTLEGQTQGISVMPMSGYAIIIN